ncbi:hypothetical protein RchiOBHm_Chr4g0402151 [Rosa chinensis]|uniref:Uncharacterized protein n=1 Tax=Rosa chinensis TaxID=74649 RepID=A0A2P6QT95_ROSCH|nr:hypothetical protein RchiOBHm_Chr4g0402151 [Rosa chinensis]
MIEFPSPEALKHRTHQKLAKSDSGRETENKTAAHQTYPARTLKHPSGQVCAT